MAAFLWISLVCEQIHGFCCIIKGHIQRQIPLALQRQLTQDPPVPTAGAHGKDGTLRIHTQNVSIHILCSCHLRLTSFIHRGMHEHRIRCFKGIPAVISVSCVQVDATGNDAIPAVPIEGIKIHIVQAGEGYPVVGLIAGIVTNC